MKIFAPCKINLFLEVKNRRPDGYHNIESVMQAASLYDELDFKKADGGISLKCNIPGLPTDERNLVIKAARLLKKELKTDSGARITLKKRIPMGAGLGGGSSDAAATLRGLLKLWKKKISAKKLVKIASSIGADVPFFLKSGPAIVRGIGDKIISLKNVRKSYFVIIYPGFGVATKWAYKNLRFPLTNKRKINKIRTLLESSRSSREWGFHIYNRLEDAVFSKYPEIPLIKDKIRGLGHQSIMSGSGSSVVGVVPSRKAGERLRRTLLSPRRSVWVVESLVSALSEDLT
jgi:4-diphosphocytidyl-2-C-methyl-D-erythritol kinase